MEEGWRLPRGHLLCLQLLLGTSTFLEQLLQVLPFSFLQLLLLKVRGLLGAFNKTPPLALDSKHLLRSGLNQHQLLEEPTSLRHLFFLLLLIKTHRCPPNSCQHPHLLKHLASNPYLKTMVLMLLPSLIMLLTTLAVV